MERKDLMKERKNGTRRKMPGRICTLLIAAMLAGGLPTGATMSTYAAEAADGDIGYGGADLTDPGTDGAAGIPGDVSGDEIPDADGEPTQAPEPDSEVHPTPAPTVSAEISPTEMPEDSNPTKEPDAAEPTPTKKPDKDDPSKEPGGEEPTPTKKPDKDDPSKEPGGEEPTPTKKPDKDDPSKEPGGEEPTPTKKPDKDDPSKEPGGEEPTPTKKPDKDDPSKEPGGEKPTPTPKPTKTPSWAVPTESDDARYQYLLGIDAKVISIDDPPEGYKSEAQAAKNMKTITVPIWKMTASGKRYTSSAQLTIHKKLAKNVMAIFKEIYALDIHFPIKVLKGYMYRKVGGVGLSKSRLMSIHSFGAAIDINPGDYDNDYFLGKGNDLRDKTNPYCIPDEVIAIFEKYGWFWGGNFEICADTMHFQYFGLGMLTYQGNSPFRTLKVKSGYMAGVDVRNLQQRLCELGFTVSVDGVYGNKTMDAVKKYQKSRGLKVTGEVNYKTWETIINETHYMSYAF